jgi:two-component sensor histidine kinase
LERDETLLKEMNHRVKNSLTIVSSMLSLQARDVGDETLAGHLTEASNRVSAIARAHERLTRQSDVRLMDIGRYIEALCQDLDASVAHCDVQVTAQQGIEIETSRAISSALIVAELITSAAKYAYPDHAPGKISIAVARHGGRPFYDLSTPRGRRLAGGSRLRQDQATGAAAGGCACRADESDDRDALARSGRRICAAHSI